MDKQKDDIVAIGTIERLWDEFYDDVMYEMLVNGTLKRIQVMTKEAFTSCLTKVFQRSGLFCKAED